MSIYSQIAKNKAKTFLIIGLFIVFMSVFFLVIGKFIGNSSSFFIFGFIFSLLSSIGSYFYSDKLVLMTTGAKPATKAQFPQLYAVVENLSMADGLPVPKIYVMQDAAPNAFATGRGPKHAVVCATTGLLERLDKTELEGVIAHELSHVKNYDILLASVVGVLVGTLGLIADWILRSMWWGGMDDRKERDNRNPLMLIFLIVLLIITPFVAMLIQLAVSRRREFLADASGALLTRYPAGLARALEKISDDPHVMQRASTSTAHLFISNPLKKKDGTSTIASLLSTHPPIQERINVLLSM